MARRCCAGSPTRSACRSDVLPCRVAIDRAAEAELCRRFAPRIRLYARKHLRGDDDANELVQRVLVVVIEALRAETIREVEHLDRFVLGTCRNVALRMRAMDRRAEPTDTALLDELEGIGPQLDALDAGSLFDCIRKLEIRALAVLHLTFYRDKSADEISEALEISTANVRVVRHRAVAALRQCMEGA